jgi:hypothetical protein
MVCRRGGVVSAMMGHVDRQMTSGPALLGELRDRLLDQVLGLLKADAVVGGVALSGSLGARRKALGAS